MDLISIIVPVYNVEHYIDKCVESIVNQTYKNLDIILVDDGSTDSSPQKCDVWAKKDSRIRVIHKENGGVSSARNAGLTAAEGAFISFVDSDDYIAPNMVDIFRSAMHDDVQFVSCNYYCVHETGALTSKTRKKVRLSGTSSIVKSYLFEQICSPSIWAKFYRKSVIENNGLQFDTSVKVGEDYLFNYFYLKHCQTAVAIDDVLYYYYRGRHAAVTASINSDLISRWKNTKKIVQLEQKTELYSTCLQKYALELLSIVRELLRSSDSKMILLHYSEIVAEIFLYFQQFIHLRDLSCFNKITLCLLRFCPSAFKWLYLKYYFVK